MTVDGMTCRQQGAVFYGSLLLMNWRYGHCAPHTNIQTRVSYIIITAYTLVVVALIMGACGNSPFQHLPRGQSPPHDQQPLLSSIEVQSTPVRGLLEPAKISSVLLGIAYYLHYYFQLENRKRISVFFNLIIIVVVVFCSPDEMNGYDKQITIMTG